MVTIKSSLFRRFPELIFGFSTKIDSNSQPPYDFNLSLAVEDEPETVLSRRKRWVESLGLNLEDCAIQKQTHGNKIRFVSSGGHKSESDAMITDTPGTGILISSADCPAIFLYDKKKKVIAGIHSGWRGTELKIVEKALNTLENAFSSKPENIYAYISPAISVSNYEVGAEVAEKFDRKYLFKLPTGKFLLDVPACNYDLLLNSGIPVKNIQASRLCTYELENLLQSYRKGGKISGRALGLIAIRRKK
ncbi:MAG: peptidoglycan editing factor PgeF [Ignavibacteriaceae bacterium]|nr:peptidoglycan editing factor PgeF [Ignavibacteriaceae bacterium]